MKNYGQKQYFDRGQSFSYKLRRKYLLKERYIKKKALFLSKLHKSPTYNVAKILLTKV